MGRRAMTEEQRWILRRALDHRKRLAKPELYRASRKAWLAKNRAKQRSYNQAWKSRDPEGYRASLKRKRERAKLRPQIRVAKAVRDSIRRALSGSKTQKSLHTMAIVGCSAEALRVHLERQFKGNMNWANYGKRWHIDHITPVSYFDLNEPAQLALCFNWQNLRPLWRKQNIKEGNRRGVSQLHMPLIWAR
jgi:hypothetical protein